MASPWTAQRTVFLHVGMHKTASTYIQKRLVKNQGLLKKNGVLLPTRRQQNNILLQAIDQEKWKPWRRWLKRAEAKTCNLLISHEALSSSLHRNCSDGETTHGQWLADRLHQCGWKLKVIGFIRDQESYLNSRYTQLVKRLAVRCDFATYTARVMQGNTISECDLMILFNWLLGLPGVERVLIPFGASNDHHGQRYLKRPDPFQQLAEQLALPERVINRCKPARSQNQQPGRLGVALALEISRFLERYQPIALKHHSRQLRGGIERMARTNGWPAEPFNGLDCNIQQAIRHRYQTSNAEFCRCFWPEVSWSELFESQRKESCKPSRTSREEDIELEACRQKVIADNLPAQMVIELPG